MDEPQRQTTSHETREVAGDDTAARHFLGSVALVAGFVLLVIAGMDSAGGTPFELPRFWYVNRTLWIFFGFALLPVGWMMLKSQPSRESGRSPLKPGIRFQRVIVYSREDCHLCEEAKAVLGQFAEYLPIVEDIDVDLHPDLQQRYGLTVPVVEIDGKVRFKGRVDPLLLRRLIEGAAIDEDSQVNL